MRFIAAVLLAIVSGLALGGCIAGWFIGFDRIGARLVFSTDEHPVLTTISSAAIFVLSVVAIKRLSKSGENPS
jgi:hypothetical protein